MSAVEFPSRAPRRTLQGPLVGCTIFAMLAVLSACGRSYKPLVWTVRFDDDATRAETRAFEVRVVQGTSCDGAAVRYRATFTAESRRDRTIDAAIAASDSGAIEGGVLDAGNRFEIETVSMPTDFDPGEYSFAVEAYDARCGIIGRACVPLRLPAQGPLLLNIANILQSPLCAADECNDGVCEMPDAGPPDTMDASDSAMGSETSMLPDVPQVTPDQSIPPDTSLPGCTPGTACTAGSLSGMCAADRTCCTGCLASGVCVAISSQQPTQCGASGGACTACGTGEACRVGYCVTTPPPHFGLGDDSSFFIRADGTACGAGWSPERPRGADAGVQPPASPFSALDTGTHRYHRIFASSSYACGLDSTLELRCWGNLRALTGLAALRPPNNPLLITGGPWLRANGSPKHACAISARDHQAYCFGEDSPQGILGVEPGVSTLPRPVRRDRRFVSISLGGDAVLGRHACGVTEDAEIYCWGSNQVRQLGAGTAAPLVTGPETAVQGTNWTDVSAGALHTCGITGGSVRCWGDSERLGNSSISQLGVSFDAPQMLGGGLAARTNFVRLSSGADVSCALTSANELFCWQRSADPVQVPGTWATVACGYSHSCGTQTNGTRWCWGLNTSGETGTGSSNGRVDPPQQIMGCP